MRCDGCKWGVLVPEQTIEHPEREQTHVVRSRWPFKDQTKTYTQAAWTEHHDAFIECHYYWPEHIGGMGWGDAWPKHVPLDWFCRNYEEK